MVHPERSEVLEEGPTSQQELQSQRTAVCLRCISACWGSREQTPTLSFSPHGSASPWLNPIRILVWEPEKWLSAQGCPLGRKLDRAGAAEPTGEQTGKPGENQLLPGCTSSLPAKPLHLSLDPVTSKYLALDCDHYCYHLSLLTLLENAECCQCFRVSVQTQHCSG